MRKIILATVFVSLMAFTEKRAVVLADYRDAYVGNYTSKRTFTHTNDAVTSLVSDVSTYTMTLQKGAADSTMIVSISEGNFTLKLKSSDLISSQKGARIWGKFFATDSIYFNFIPGHAPLIYLYRGKKQP